MLAWRARFDARILVAIAVAAITLVGVSAPVAAAKTPPDDWATGVMTATRTMQTARAFVRIEFDGASKNGVVTDAEVDFAAAAGHGTSGPTSNPKSLEFFVLGEQSWITSKDAPFTRELPPGATYVAVPTVDLVRSGAFSLDPETFFGPLSAMLGAKKTQVTETKTGKRYTFDVDLAKAAREMPDEWRAGFDFAYSNFDPRAIKRARGRVVVDDQGRVRSATFRFKDASDRPASFAVDVRIDRYDEPVVVTPPPPDQVVDISAVPAIKAGLGLS